MESQFFERPCVAIVILRDDSVYQSDKAYVALNRSKTITSP